MDKSGTLSVFININVIIFFLKGTEHSMDTL